MLITYTNSTTDFPNPERGASIDHLIQSPTQSPISAFYLNTRKSEDAVTLTRLIYVLSAHRSSPISDAWLDRMEQDFAAIRSAGYKAVLRFAYNWLGEDRQDAPKSRILAHLVQLEPILTRNKDVIYFMEAGFVGAWGEWHSSTNGLDFWKTDNVAARNEIIQALLNALPGDRMIAVRYRNIKTDFLGHDRALTSTQAFQNTPQARLGAHNDCFVSEYEDHGTYPSEPAQIEAYKQYFEQDNKFVIQGGETCALHQTYSQCANAISEMKRMKFSQLNLEFHPDVWQLWRTGGCYAEIKRRLGYRLRLASADLPANARAGATMRCVFNFRNDGFAPLFNSRPTNIVLRNTVTNAEYTIPLGYDIRRLPIGSVVAIDRDLLVPANVPEGNYAMLLHLRDPLLPNRPEYAVRLANQDMWQSGKGYNNLNHVVAIAA